VTVDTKPLTDALATLPDAALRIVMGAASSSPEMMRRAAVCARLRIEGVTEDDSRYLAAMEEVQILAILMLQRAQLQTEKELAALAAVIVKWALQIAASVLSAAI